jgi:hypothetical protein
MYNNNVAMHGYAATVGSNLVSECWSGSLVLVSSILKKPMTALICFCVHLQHTFHEASIANILLSIHDTDACR